MIAGPPNAGKSSLINTIAGSEKAIVTEVPGTTRDQIEVPLSIDGVPIVLTDTAGLRDTDDTVEAIGIGRAKQLARTADLLVWLGDDEPPPTDNAILVHAKADLPERAPAPEGRLGVSGLSGAGVAELLGEIVRRVRQMIPQPDQIALNRRQWECIADAHAALTRAGEAGDGVIVAEELRWARAAFDRLTGRSGVEDMLDSLFSRFCLGK